MSVQLFDERKNGLSRTEGAHMMSWVNLSVGLLAEPPGGTPPFLEGPPLEGPPWRDPPPEGPPRYDALLIPPGGCSIFTAENSWYDASPAEPEVV